MIYINIFYAILLEKKISFIEAVTFVLMILDEKHDTQCEGESDNRDDGGEKLKNFFYHS